ncbi:MAG TPA: 2OG-Fe(II) oxygenase family protein [Pseudomonadales bacterium]|nr:2OG-Fe(II) oxygenase family protein [Pseudomonadales bacterium]
MMELSIDRSLDLAALRTRFHADAFVQVTAPFAPQDAERLHACLTQDVPWGFAWYDEGPRHLRAAELQAMPAQAQRALQTQIHERARDAYQYAYGTYPMLDAYLQGWGEVPLLDGFLEALNSAPVLDLVRGITGLERIVKADAQATRFGPGQFLRQHSDVSPADQEWLVAYVYNLTPYWQPDWGGYLQFLEASGDVRRGLMPRFNVLNLLAVPQAHLVSAVSAFAGAPRYAITGWFRAA